MFDRFPNPPLKSILMFPYYVYHHLFLLFRALASGFQPIVISQRKLLLRCCFTISIIIHFYLFILCYFIVPLFHYTRFNCFIKWTFVLLTLGNFLYYIIFWSHPFIRRCLVQIFKNILQYILCYFYVQLLTLNDSMLFYCFNHNFNDIFMVNLFE